MTKRQFWDLRRRRGQLVLAALIGGCIVLALLGDPARDWLRYERTALAQGQWWRLLSAHLVHLGPAHTVLNMAGLVLVVWLFLSELRLREWVLCGLGAALVIGLGLYGFSAQVAWYVGMSGVLHGWFAFGAARSCQTQGRLGAAMLAALAAKIAFEQLRGTMPFTTALDIGPVVVDAHLYGAVAGILCYVTFGAVHRLRRSSL